MPSIIERISEAEAEASAIRRNAVVSARETAAGADEAAKDIIDKAREAQRTKLAEAEASAKSEGEVIAEKIRRDNAKKADELIAGARSRLDSAEAYILERVVKA